MTAAMNETRTGVRDEIVVGLDDSPAGRAALAWAADHARLTGFALRAVCVVDWPTGMGPDGTLVLEGLVYSADVEVSNAFQSQMEAIFTEVDPEKDWTLQFEKGKAGAILVRESRQSRLLVVGTGEHVGLGRMLIGSTSHYCLSHALRPVVAVPTGSAAAGRTS